MKKMIRVFDIEAFEKDMIFIGNNPKDHDWALDCKDRPTSGINETRSMGECYGISGVPYIVHIVWTKLVEVEDED